MDWNRLPEEPAVWFNRFDLYYRPVGPERSLLGAYNEWRKVEKGRGYSTGYPINWKTAFVKWHWQERAESWDAEERKKRILAEEKAREEMLRRHAKIGRDLQSLASEKLKYLPTDELESTEVRMYLKDGIKIERDASGLPSDVLAIVAMSDEELLKLYKERFSGLADSGSGDEASGDRDSDSSDD